jgi:hypothetical protein
MGDSFDRKSEAVCQPLAETKAWCGKQKITASVEEKDDVKHRRALGQQVGQLIRCALMESNGLWNRIFRRNYTDTRLWRKAMEMYRQADLSSIAPLEAQLRTPSLRPKTSLGEVRIATDRQELVCSVVVRRSELVHGQDCVVDGSEGKLLLTLQRRISLMEPRSMRPTASLMSTMCHRGIHG